MNNVQPITTSTSPQYWCSYQSPYSPVYESGYQPNFIFCDEDELDDDNDDFFDAYTPLLPGGFANG